MEHKKNPNPKDGLDALKCVNCGMATYHMDKNAQKNFSEKLTKQQELEEKWCKKGHLLETKEKSYQGWSEGPIREYTIRECAMCGKRGKAKY